MVLSEDVEYLIDRLENQERTNQCVVVYEEKCCKIERENYYPNDDGIITFHRKTDWISEGYSVAEMLELLKGCKEKNILSDIRFEEVGGSTQKVVNVYESDSIGDKYEFDCFITVGDGNEVMKREGNPMNQNWVV